MEMYELFCENVHRIVDSPLKRDELIKQGFALVQTPVDIAAEEEEIIKIEEESKDIGIYLDMTYTELQKLAKEKGIEIKRDWKKPELIEAIKAAGDTNGTL